MKVLCTAFLSLRFGFGKSTKALSYKKWSRKMLMKLTPDQSLIREQKWFFFISLFLLSLTLSFIFSLFLLYPIFLPLTFTLYLFFSLSLSLSFPLFLPSFLVLSHPSSLSLFLFLLLSLSFIIIIMFILQNKFKLLVDKLNGLHACEKKDESSFMRRQISVF